MRRLRDKIGIIIVKHLGSKNPSYPNDSYTSRKFIALADELACMLNLSGKVEKAIKLAHIHCEGCKAIIKLLMESGL